MAPQEPTYKINPFGEKRLLFSEAAELIYSVKSKEAVALLVDQREKRNWRLIIFGLKESPEFPNRLRAIGYLESYLCLEDSK